MFREIARGDTGFMHYVLSIVRNYNTLVQAIVQVYRTIVRLLNLLKPTGHVMHQQFNIQQLYVLPTLYLCVLYLSEKNSDLCHLQHKLIGFYNRDEKCLLRGTNWVFK